MGFQGEKVLAAQARLIALHYLEADAPTDVFGIAMREAVRLFLRRNGLAEEDFLSESAYNLLLASNALSYGLSVGDEGEEIRSLQSRLYELGYLSQSFISAKFDEETESALKKFQEKTKRSKNGLADEETLAKLYEEESFALSKQIGDSGDDIKEAQKKLKTLQYLPSNYKIKGDLDEETASAIKWVQIINGLIVDGILGPDVLDCIQKSGAQRFTIKEGMRGDDIHLVQERLYQLGYIGRAQITGIFGEGTGKAVSAFQKRNGLNARTYLNRAAWDLLLSQKARAAAQPVEDIISEEESFAEEKLYGVEKLIQVAQSKLGSPYIRGAKGPNSFDCSGFIYWCLKQSGVNQRYLTSAGWSKSNTYKKISDMNQLKAGDILVFSGDNGGTGHVGIYLGEGYMIDASSSAGRVRTKCLADEIYWEHHFICAFRIWL
jgi:peptidoglycan hydrolase-like protein with peptidoglycan-binding domain